MSRYKKTFFNIIVPLILFILPLRHINQGIDISDTGYTLANFKWFGIIEYPWHYSIAGANVIGKALMNLPGGDTWVGINLYCSLLTSIMALACFFFLKKRLNEIAAAIGIFLAEMMCWCPQVILYNYLTFIFLNLGTMLIICGIEDGIAGRKKREAIIYLLTGVMLGLEVSVRLANLDHMALVTLIWYSGIIHREKLKDIIVKTSVCILGYAAGILAAIGLIMSCTISGLSGYLDMVKWVGYVSSKQEGYSALYMITSPFLDYLDSLKWLLPLLILTLVFAVFDRNVAKVTEGQKTLKIAGNNYAILLLGYRLVFVCAELLLLRILYGRGMFGLNYNEYFSIIRPICIFIAVGIILLIWSITLGQKYFTSQEKLLILGALVIALVLPLGSNNRSYPVLNNLFFVAPVVIWLVQKFWPKNFEVKSTVVILGLLLLIQASGFGYTFVFRDSSSEEKRNTKIENSDILIGMKTASSKAKVLSELSELTNERKLYNRSGIFYGDIAGLSYGLNIQSALSGIWVSLESYTWKMWNDDMGLLYYKAKQGDVPVIFIAKEYDIFPDDDKKRESLDEYMKENNYGLIYDSYLLSVYDVR